MALPTDADIPLILSRIRPGAAWRWTGTDGTYDDPAELIWTDPVQTEPTLTELETDWTAHLAEQTTTATVQNTLKTAFAPLVGRQVSALTNPELVLLVEILCYVFDGVDHQTRLLKPANQWDLAKRALKA